MLSSKVRPKHIPRLAEDVSRAFWLGLFDAADHGFRTSYNRAPIGATNTLRHSGVQPAKDGNEIVWGYTAPYAGDVERGTPPHHVPLENLKLWARRVLGDESAAGAVQAKIAARGTRAQPFVQPGVDALLRRLQQSGLRPYVAAERRRHG